MSRKTEHAHKAANGTGKNLERRAFGHYAAGCRSAYNDNDKRNNCKDGFNKHRTVTDKEHVFFVGNGFGRSTGGYQAVEARHSAAGDGDEKYREQRLAIYNKAVKRRQFDRRIGEDNTDNAAGNHA